MNTAFLMMAEFGTADVPLEQVAQKYLGLDARVAKMRAARGELPFPAYRASSSQKAPWLVHVTDLAAWLVQARERAAADWQKRQVA